MLKTLLLLLAWMSLSRAAFSQHAPGSLDSFFGVDGVVIDSFTDGRMMSGYDIQVQPDGKIVTVGFSINRYLPDGKPDLSFGTDGRVVLSALRPGVDMSLAGMLHFRPDGRMVVIGSFDSVFYHQGYALQLLPNGTVDSTFGVNGYAFLRFTGMTDSKLMRDGSIITVTNEEDVYLDRIKANGTYDNSFGVNGMTSAYSGHYAGGFAHIDTTADGRIVIAAIGYDPGWTRSAMLMRFLGNGIPDSSFGTNCKSYYFPVSYCRDMAVQKDGKVLAAFGSLDETYILRFAADGTVDASFGANGAFTIPYRLGQFKLIDSDQVICAGSDDYFLLSKIHADGRGFDSSFGLNGTVRTIVKPADRDRAYALCVQSDHRVLTAGESRTNGQGLRRLMLTRHHDIVPSAAPSDGVSQSIQAFLCLYPNPASTTLSLSGIPGALFKTPFQIVNATGQVVQRGTLPPAASHTLPISMLPAGLYYLRLPSATLPFLKH